MAITHNGNIRLAYETFGDSGVPLLLISGTGVQMLAWPEAFCRELVERGFHVARFDNRDAGESTHLAGTPMPNLLRVMLHPDLAPYGLVDMATDALAVMEALGWSAAHVVGASMGGMIAQELALRHPWRVLTLTSIMSTSSARIATLPNRSAMKAINALDRMPIRNAEDAGEQAVALKRVIGAGAHPLDEEAIREMGRRAHLRCPADEDADRRQRLAVVASGDRRRRLGALATPTLVIHGAKDPVIGVRGGRSTAAAIPGARLKIFPGMAHDLPSALWPEVLDEIEAIASIASR